MEPYNGKLSLQRIIGMVFRNEDVNTLALPKGAVARLGRGVVTDISFSPDTEMLAVGSRIGAWLYCLSKQSVLALLDTKRGVVFAVALSLDGRLLATGNWDGDVKVWDVQTQLCISETKREAVFDAASQLVFSPDGQCLASSGGYYDAVYIWHPRTGERIAKFTLGNLPRQGPRPYIIPLAFSPDSEYLAVATADNTISVWDIETGERVVCFSGHVERVVAIAFSPCGRFIASGDQKGTLQQWDVRTAYLIEPPVQYSKNAVIPSYTVDSVLRAAAVYKTTIAVWDVNRNEKLTAFNHNGEIGGRCFSNGTHLIIASSSDFKMWTADENDRVSSIPGHTHIPFSLAFSPDGQNLASVGSGLATCWDITTKQTRWISSTGTYIHSLSFSTTGSKYGFGTREDILALWNFETNEPMLVLAEKNKYLKIVPALKGSMWAGGDIEGKVYVWDRQGKQTLYRGHTDSIEALVFSPNGKQLASASRDKTFIIWDVATGEQIISLPLLSKRLAPEIYTGDPHIIQSVLSGENPCTQEAEIKSITFSPSGNLIAAGFEGRIQIWDAETYETYMIILPARNYRRQYALAFSPCGCYLASGAWWWNTEKVPIYLWEVTTGENITTFWGHPTDVQDLVFSPDGALLASGSYDGTILLWNLNPFTYSRKQNLGTSV